MRRWDWIFYLIVVGAMVLDWIFAVHAFNESNTCEGLKCFAGIVMLGLCYIATLLHEICDRRKKQ